MNVLNFKRVVCWSSALVIMAIASPAIAAHLSLDLSSPDGSYYVYARPTASELGVSSIFDVDAHGDYVYANVGPGTVARWEVSLSGGTDPNLHPDNPDATGAIVDRVFSAPTYYTGLSIGGLSVAEIYAADDALYYRSGGSWGARNGNLVKYDFATATESTVISGGVGSFVAYDEVNDVWYTGGEYERAVYGYDGSSWSQAFTYDNMAGSHMDGLEFVNGALWVSDMTSDYLLQAVYDGSAGDWVVENLFSYNDPTSTYVEGMGFGALDHFWVGAGNRLVEIGGGELQQEIIEDVPEPSTLVLLGAGLLGVGWLARRAE